jgi:homoserine dehydrogenase
MVNIGIIGLGTVATGTVRILLENSDILQERLGFAIKLKKIAVRDIHKQRGVDVPEGCLMIRIFT